MNAENDTTNIIPHMITNSPLLLLLNEKDVFNSSLVSKQWFAAVGPFISSHYSFKLEPATNYHWYQPKKITVNESFPVRYPPYVESITLGPDFNHPNGGKGLPPNLTTLTCGDFFNQPLPSLPPKLTTLILGKKYNKPFSSLPPSLTYIDFGSNFLQPLPSLPPSLSHLVLKSNFNYDISSLPPSVTHLSVSNYSQLKEQLKKAESVIYLKMDHHQLHYGKPEFPPNLQQLVVIGQCFDFTCRITSWPKHLKELTCSLKTALHSQDFMPPIQSRLVGSSHVLVKFK